MKSVPMIINAHLWHEAGCRINEEGLSAYWLFETAAEEAREGGFHSTWRPPQRGLKAPYLGIVAERLGLASAE